MTLTFDLLLDGREVDVALDGATTSIEYDLNVDSTLAVALGVRDQQRALFTSGILDRNDDGCLDRLVEILIDGAWYRLASFNKAGDAFTLGFEDRSAARMRGARGKRKPRAGEDHVRFVKQLCSLAGVPFATPTGVAVSQGGSAKQVKQQRADADTRREKGIPAGAELKVKGADAKPDQIRNIEISLGVAAREKAGERPVQAQMCAAIGESGIRDVPNAGGSPYGGVYQALKSRGLTTAQQSHYFLRGGQGFQQGGAIALAKAHPDMSPGEIALRVEGSRANFASEAAGIHFYQQHLGEANAIIAAYGGATGGSTGPTVSRAAALVQRGTPEDPNESSWAAAQRIGKAKGYRLFCDRNTVIYADEHDLIDSRAQAILSEGSPGVDWIDGEQVPGKKVNAATASVLASLWALPPGCAVIVKDTGPLDGRWLVSSFKRSRHSVRASVELRRGTELLQPEPTTELSTSTALGAGTQSGAASAAGGSLVDICRRFTGSYRLGGGHGVALSSVTFSQQLDCSSSSSKALREAGMFTGTVAIVSGQFASSWGKPGRGEEFTVWANAGHVFIQGEGANNWRFDTGGPGGGAGPRLREQRRPTAGFTPRHWPSR